MGRFHALLCLVGVSCAILVPQSIRGQGGCGQECQTLDDCQGQLICANGQCNDDPDVGTHICSGSGSGSGSGSTPDGGTDGCQQSGTLRGTDGNCDTSDGSECCKSSETYTTYTCSPPVSSQTPAVLTWNSFEEGGSGGGASQCDEQFHSNSELIVALSTGWFDNERRCRKQIKITAENGQSVEATVVDQCDSTTGCDKQHDFQPPCRNNVVDGSSGVWDALGLNKNLGTVSVTWSDT